MDAFVVNGLTLVIASPRVTLGGVDSADVNLRLRGATHGAAVTICRDLPAPARDGPASGGYWVCPADDAPPAVINGRVVAGYALLKDRDRLQLGGVALRVHDPSPGSASLLFEFLGGGSVGMGRAENLRRFVLLGRWVRVASEYPCHIGVAGISPDAVELAVENRQVVCRSESALSVFSESPSISGECERAADIPGDLYVLPLTYYLAPGRHVARLSFSRA